MKIGNFRGQAAVEYLMTYGWAILVLVIIIGAILSSGVLSPTYLIAEECRLSQNMQCNFQLYEKDGSLNLKFALTNGFGYKIKITNIEISLPEENNMKFTLSQTVLEPESGATVTVDGKIPNYPSSRGTIKRMNTVVKYFSCAPEINKDCDPDLVNEHTLSGKITGRVEAG